MWLILALFSALFYSFRRVSEKRLAARIDHFTLGWAVQAFSLPVITLLLFGTIIPNLFTLSPTHFWLPLFIIWLILYPVQAFFYYQSLKQKEISHVLPLMSLIPVFSVFFSWILLKETPTTIGFVGIMSIVAGIYILNLQSKDSFLTPVLYLFKDNPSRYMLINSISLSIGSVLDKIAINVSTPLFYNFINTLGASLILFLFAKRANPHLTATVKKNGKGLTIVGTFQALGFSLYVLSLTTGLVSYVAAIKSVNVVLAGVWGILFLHEKLTKQRFLSLILVFLGIVLLSVQ